MISYHAFCQIKYLHEHQGLNASQIAREMSLHPHTVSYWLAQDHFRPPKRVNRPSKLDPFRGYIAYYLREVPYVPATLVYQRLLKLGFDGKLTILRKYLHARRDHVSLQANGVPDPSLHARHTPEEIQEIGYIWVLKVIQGGVNHTQLAKRFAERLDVKDIGKLHDAIIHRSLKYRNRAMTILLYLENISQHTISRYLFLSRRAVKNYIDLYNAGGVDNLFSPKRTKIKKYRNSVYKETLFKILHAPPSTYNINRTTWKMDDLQRIMTLEGFGVCKDIIRRIIKDAGYTVRKAKKVLTSNDPHYREKLENITHILSHLGPKEKFFSVDEYGPFAVKIRGGRSLVGPGEIKTIPQIQESKGSLIFTAALELSTNQVTHFYSGKKDTKEMIKLIETLIKEYINEDCLYFSWDAASWHSSKLLYEKVRELNSRTSSTDHKIPNVKFVPLPSRAQFLNVIESVFSGMSRAIIHNSDYQSVEEAMKAIDRYFAERNQYFKENPKRAGNKIWGKERVATAFSESNNCKDSLYR